MEFSMKRVNALVIKEFIDLKKNVNVSFMCILPILLAIIYSKFANGAAEQGKLLSLCLNMNLTLVASTIMAMLIAEEKEKNTLRTLMLSGVSPVEFLVGKAIITLVICTIINIIMFFIIGVSFKYFIQYLIIGLILSIIMIILGAVIGIISKNQMATGTIGMPFTMALFMIPVFANLNKTVKAIANFLPTYHSQQILIDMFKGESLLSGKFHLLVLLIWIIISVILFAYIYKTTTLDD